MNSQAGKPQVQPEKRKPQVEKPEEVDQIALSRPPGQPEGGFVRLGPYIQKDGQLAERWKFWQNDE
jgi:hypothetical protein